MDFNFSGKKVVTGDLEGILKIWKIKIDESVCIFSTEGHYGPILSLNFSLDGRKIVSGSEDKSIKVW